MFNDLEHKLRKPKTVGLLRKVLSEFKPNPSGLYLPNNKVMKYADITRVYKVALKIISGFHFHHHNVYVPANTRARIDIITMDEPVPDYFRLISDTELIGTHPRIFSYRYKHIPEWQGTC